MSMNSRSTSDTSLSQVLRSLTANATCTKPSYKSVPRRRLAPQKRPEGRVAGASVMFVLLPAKVSGGFL